MNCILDEMVFPPHPSHVSILVSPMDSPLHPQQSQPTSPYPGADIPRYSINWDSDGEIARYKWIESERHGYDVGETAIRRWVKRHWHGYLRARWLEHLEGNRYWIELDRGDFGLLQHAAFLDQELLPQIVEKLKRGEENLGVLCWAAANHLPTESVVRILLALDINSRRLLHRFECC